MKQRANRDRYFVNKLRTASGLRHRSRCDLSQEPVHQHPSRRPGTRSFAPRGLGQVMRRNAQTCKLNRPVTRHPSRDDCLIGLRVELRPKTPSRPNRLGANIAEREHLCRRRSTERIGVPLHPGSRQRRIRGWRQHLAPPHLGSLRPLHRAPQTVSQHLCPETDTKNGNATTLRIVHQRRLRLHVARNIVPIHRPVRAQMHQQINPSK